MKGRTMMVEDPFEPPDDQELKPGMHVSLHGKGGEWNILRVGKAGDPFASEVQSATGDRRQIAPVEEMVEGHEDWLESSLAVAPPPGREKVA